MKAVVQRVSRAEVRIQGECAGAIGGGLLVLLGVGKEDTEADADALARKILNLRIYEDAQGKMNLSLRDVNGGMLVVSQFTLYGDCRKGNRPSFGDAAPPDRAERLYERFLHAARESGIPVESGRFQAIMDVELTNHGPVTLLLESRKRP